MNDDRNQNVAEAASRAELRSRIRPLTDSAPAEVFLPFLDLCVNWSMDKPRVEIDELRAREDTAFYFKDWGRKGDIGVAAHSPESDSEIIGLAWLRLADIEAVVEKSAAGSRSAADASDGADGADAVDGESHFTGYGWVAADIPELSLAVLPDHQSQGIGGMLLEVACTLARMSGVQAVSLAVADGNGAARLYHDHGFVAVGRNGDSDVLVRRLV